MTTEGYLKDSAQNLLRLTLAALTKMPVGRGEYRTRVYQALMLASQLGYQTGVAEGMTDKGAPIIDAVINLPTGMVRFRMPYYLGAGEYQDPAIQAIVIGEFLASPVTAGAPLMHNGSGCCVHCYNAGTKSANYCGDTRCKCHERRG